LTTANVEPRARESTGAAAKLTLATALLLTLGAAADPSGIFTIVGWTGGDAVRALWWWAPYLAYIPLLLLFSFLGAKAVLDGETELSRRQLLLLRLWAVTILATSAAEFLYSMLLIAPLALRGRFAIPLGDTAAFLLWSSGYGGFKMALIGWIPALVGAMGFRTPSRRGSLVAAPSPVALFTAGGALLILVLLGPWLARHWWHGSPIGFVYPRDSPLLAPTPASGARRCLIAIAIMGFFIWHHTGKCLAGTVRERSAPLFWVGATAGFASVAALFLGQLLELVLGTHQDLGQDFWLVPATLLRAVEAAALTPAVALATGCMAVVGARLVAATGKTRGTLSAAALRRAGCVMALGAVALAVFAALRFDGGESHLTDSVRLRIDEPQRLSVKADADGPTIADSLGSKVTLRGVNVNQLGSYYQQDHSVAGVRPLTDQDFADIAALGLNVVRLTLSWSELEPEPGRISEEYLLRIRRAVDMARSHRIYVLLDMHQDAWGEHVAAPPDQKCRRGTAPMIGWDGAPEWATFTDNTAPCQVSGRDLAPNVSRAFQSFYMDRDDIQTSLIRVWRALAHEFAGDSTIAGYDLINEPNFGDTPPTASTLLLANYYARCIQSIRQSEDSQPNGFHHLVFIEPSIIWSGFGLDNLPPRGFTSDRQIVFSPHLYSESITADQGFGFNLISIERSFALARAAAAQLEAPLWIGEWGFFKAPQSQAALFRRQVEAEDSSGVGSAIWVWKQACGDPHVYPGKIAGNIRLAGCPGDVDLGTASDVTGRLRRPYVRTAPGRRAALTVDGARLLISGSYAVNRVANRPLEACDLEIWVPGDSAPKVESLSHAEVTRIARVEPGSVSLGPSGGWLVSGCVAEGEYRISLN
jgi:hypothetical protein